jgi:hypothetical protein
MGWTIVGSAAMGMGIVITFKLSTLPARSVDERVFFTYKIISIDAIWEEVSPAPGGPG